MEKQLEEGAADTIPWVVGSIPIFSTMTNAFGDYIFSFDIGKTSVSILLVVNHRYEPRRLQSLQNSGRGFDSFRTCYLLAECLTRDYIYHLL